ncbi:MAG: carboxypeptidase-like regulatory domain-containing protein, partial [Eudoraea sp.]|nr:carboxypeptidase-like regulatory domain-containing protein [Eudoraea sp.]
YSQVEGTLAGTITDQEVYNEGIVFADVRLKNTDIKVQTNFRGNFEIKDIEAGNYTVEVSYLGYETLEIPVVIQGNEVTIVASSMAAKQLGMEDMTLLDITKKNNDIPDPVYSGIPKK